MNAHPKTPEDSPEKPAEQAGESPGAAAPSAAAAINASMNDMLRMMDVASALRRERETAEAQLDLATAKQQLRKRLMATAEAAGEDVKIEEIDAAIDEYFKRQHRYEDPPASWGRFWASVWVMRNKLLVALLLVLLLAAIVIGAIVMVNRGGGEPEGGSGDDGAARAARSAPTRDGRAYADFETLVAAGLKMAADEDARSRIAAIATDGETAFAANNGVALRTSRRKLDELLERLRAEYEVRIVSRPGQLSGIDRKFNGRVSGLYLIVEAITPAGKRLTLPIANGEKSGQIFRVKQWGEQVEQRIWDRIVADKKADGVVDENVFARKARGFYRETVVLEDGRGGIVKRGRQITEW